jgi:hypothetical protein
MNLGHKNNSEIRTPQIQRFQGAIRLERLGQLQDVTIPKRTICTTPMVNTSG